VIFDGAVMGSLRFELEKMEWVFIPRLEAARRMSDGKKWLIVDKGAVDYIIKGASVLAPELMMRMQESLRMTKWLS